MKRLGIAFVALFVCVAVPPGRAAEISIGIKTDTTSIDPHFSYIATNQTAAGHIFDALIERGPNLEMRPALALSWRAISPSLWEFKLRPGVVFHDGSPFTAEDVIFTFARLPNVPNSPASFAGHARRAGKITAVDPLTLRFETPEPYPALPLELSEVSIVSKRAAEGATTADFNAGKAAIGTGPFRLVSWTPRERLVLERNERYWGAKPAYERAVLRPIAVDAPRVAALLAGNVDMIDVLPADTVPRLKANRALNVFAARADRVMYVHMDSHRDVTPFVTAKNGAALDRNPLKDRRVRLALSKAINRTALAERVMEGLAEPAGQIAVPGMVGFNPDVKPEPLDVDGARRLLAEAGWPDGFALTLHATNDRYPNDVRLAESLAQMLARVGVEVKVEAIPSAIYFTRASRFEFSFFSLGYGSSQGTASHGLRGVVLTHDPAKGHGPSNRGRYSNPEVDLLTLRSQETFDEAESIALQKRATAIAMADVGVLPLYYLFNTWATKASIVYEPRMDERTFAHSARPK
ncbi:MAG: ABC transporter substrate-binding protein [Tagaea sp.]|nr:ABC transporter substrate-binding protein [Tagaea sp.]